VASEERPNRKGRILAASSSLKICSLMDKSSSAECVSARAMSGITLVNSESRRRYSRSTGLSPKPS
jgi:hypothetical protein